MDARRSTGSRSLPVLTLLACIATLFWAVAPSYAQQATGSTASTQSEPKPPSEISEQEQTTTFKVKVNLVLVRVVVRDDKGNAIGDLHKEDFQLFDDRKPQAISKFSVEQPGSISVAAEATAEVQSGEKPQSNTVSLPEHYIALLFDDVHLKNSDLLPVRNAADQQLASLAPTDRAAIFTTSGQNVVDFTDDRQKLHQSLLQLRSRPIAGGGFAECPDVSYYMADLIQNKYDSTALAVATEEALSCAFGGDSRSYRAAQATAQAAAARELSIGEHETNVALNVLGRTVQRMGALPGQRTIILLSPGFYNPSNLQAESEIIDRATRANVIINSLDARGLYTIVPGGDASERGVTTSAFAAGHKTQYQSASASADADVMANLAYGTGGTFFHNSNDLKGGLARLASAPEYFYVLGFTPQKLKYDGRFHKLKVVVTTGKKLNVQARQGYYAPKHVADPSEEAKQEIEDALFSQEVLQDLPIQLHTQFFKSSDTEAKLSVVAKVDAKRLRFQKVEGRNRNDLTVVAGVFDRNGNFVAGNEKILQMRLKDDTLQNKLDSGLTMRTSFDLKPGSYLVRLVVRDDSGLMAAQNGAVEIP